MARFALAAILIGHGVAHLPGFAVAWRLMESAELPYRTTILAGRLDVGDAGIRMMGLVWAGLAMSFIALSLAVWFRAPGTRPLIVAAVAISVVMCALGWPDTRIGLIANVIVVGLLTIAV